MKNIHFILLFIVSAVMVTSCGKDYRRNPGKAYAPDMTYSQAFDFYNSTERIEAAGGTFNKMPVKNTIAREQAIPTHLGENDTTAAYGLSNPYELYAKDLAQGKRLYLIHCGICHGEKLDGQGPLYTSEKYLAAPANLIGAKYLNFSQGKIYHAIVYGKNMMGSYASQLDPKQRWQVVSYIKSVQAENGGAAFDMISEEPEVEEVVEAAHDDEEHGQANEDHADTDHEHADGDDHAH